MYWQLQTEISKSGAWKAYSDITFMKGASHKKDNIVNHVTIGAVIQECAEGLISLHNITRL